MTSRACAQLHRAAAPGWAVFSLEEEKTGQITAVTASEATPSSSQALEDHAWTDMSTTQRNPATATPVPTPAKSTPARIGRPRGISRSRHQDEVCTSTQALATPAAKRSAAQAAKPASSAIASVANA